MILLFYNKTRKDMNLYFKEVQGKNCCKAVVKLTEPWFVKTLRVVSDHITIVNFLMFLLLDLDISTSPF